MIRPARVSALLVAVLGVVHVTPAAAQIRIDRIDPAEVCPGEDFAVVGSFGAEPARYSIRIPAIDVFRRDGVISWGEARLSTTLPAGSLAPGTYRLEIWTDGRRRASYASFRVACGGSPAPAEPLTFATEVAASASLPSNLADDIEIQSARGRRPGPAKLGPYELRVRVHNKGTGARRFLVAPAYVDGGVVKVGERGFLRGGDTMTLSLELDVREDALVLGGSSFSTKVFLVDPEATGGYDRQLYRDGNMDNHIRQVGFQVKWSDTYTVTVRMIDITVHNGCDDIEDGNSWIASLRYDGPLRVSANDDGVWNRIRPGHRHEGGLAVSPYTLPSRAFDLGTLRVSRPALRFFDIPPDATLTMELRVMDPDPHVLGVGSGDQAAREVLRIRPSQWQRGTTLRFSHASVPGGADSCPPGTVSFGVQASSESNRTGS